MTVSVMLADDEEEILALLSATLGHSGRYRLLMAREGKEALDIARKEKPDLLFLDIMMPKKDGYEVCRALKSDPATSAIKVIMLTGLAQEADRSKAMEAGADGYFTKPFSPTALLEKVNETLSLS
ncbi:MAG: two-component system response regulator [Dehalococcoidia bacterium]